MKEFNAEWIFNEFSEVDARFCNGILARLKKIDYTFPDFDKEFPAIDSTSFISQGKTGYCWLLSALHCIEYFTHKKYGRTDIHFSVEYLIFWDKVEKANWFLEQLINRFPWNPDNREIRYLLSRAMTDRGQWNMAHNLIQKYGLIPIRKDSESLHGTGELNACLSMLLRNSAIILNQAYCAGESSNELSQLKDTMLMEIIKVLCNCYGVPAKLISSNYALSIFGLDDPISPKELFDQIITFPFDEYICIFNDGNVSVGNVMDSVILDTNMVGGISPGLLHVTEDVFFESVHKQISEGIPCWFSCDAGKFNFKNVGVFDDTGFDFDKISSLFGETMTKTNINHYGIAGMTHSMTMKQTKCIGKSIWWQAYDSAEFRANTRQISYLSDNWMRKYVFQAVVHKSYLNNELLALAKHQEVCPWDICNTGNF